jgi:ATP/maltotriose-dependent transcriptional regulator MalT
MLRRDTDVTRRAWHLAGATDGPDAATAAELERAGEYSYGRGAYAVAAETFERSAELTPDDAERARRLLAAGDAYWLAGQIERSAQVLDAALNVAADQQQRADVLLKRMMTQRSRSFADVFQELTREAAATEAVDRDRAAMLYAQAVFPGIACMHYDAALRSATRAIELLDPASPMHFVAQVLHALVAEVTGAHHEAMRVLRAFVTVFDATGPGPQFSGLAEYTALCFLADDDFTTAFRLVDEMVNYARRESALGLLSPPLVVRAELRRRTGAWRSALADATESLAIISETEHFMERVLALMALGRLHGGLGRFEEARALLGEAVSLAADCECESLRWMASYASGFVELTAMELEAARAHLLVSRDCATRGGDRTPSLWPWQVDLVEVAALLGDDALAREVSARLDEDAELHGGVQARAFAARARGIIAGDESAMRAEFEASLALLGGVPVPFERARTHLVFGEALLRYGHRPEAETHLALALDAFDQLDAHPWSARARKHLAPSEPPSSAALDGLTDRELQVAVAVSTGRTSNEAAAELFVSRRTVEHHLAIVYRKLGIRNRTQLAALMNDRGPDRVPS